MNYSYLILNSLYECLTSSISIFTKSTILIFVIFEHIISFSSLNRIKSIVSWELYAFLIDWIIENCLCC